MAETTELVHERPAESPEEHRTTRTSGRTRVAEALAFVALVAALIGAIGPAEHLRTRYTWPPSPLPAGTPSREWYTPLLLIRHEPEAISARLPCSLRKALPEATPRITVLATARVPEAKDGLAITSVGRQLVVGIGTQVLTRVDLARSSDDDRACAYELGVANDRWSIQGGPNGIAQSGAIARMPFVSGLFSELDLRSGASPSIDLTTTVHGARTTARQTIAWTVAALAIVAALLLVAVERRPRWSWAARTGLVRKALGNAAPADAVVAVVLLGWWVISPAFYDDGWVIARQRAFSAAGGFSNYYSTFGTNLPNGYWLEWLQHWLTQSSTALLVLRIPPLLCLAATWVLCRWILSRTLRSLPGGDQAALWALTAAFVLGAMAWGITLRPEPATALLVTGVLACMVRFLERETVAPVAVAAVLVSLAVSAHHSGLVSIAPIVVVTPTLVPWARRRLPAVATIVAASVALIAVLSFVGSDADLRRADARASEAFATSAISWSDEILRYANLALPFYGTPLRRASVALMALALLAFVLRRRRTWRALFDLPASTLAVGLLLLIATPSKWPWHFGALLGVAAVAVVAETARVREEASRSAGWQVRPFLAIGAAIVAVAWSWSWRQPWGLLDVRTLDWNLGLERWLPISRIAVALPALLLVGALLAAVFRRSGRLHELPWRTASWTVPALTAPVIAFTAAVLVADTAKTTSWTLARQNLEAASGETGCGLADDALLADKSSMRSLAFSRVGVEGSLPGWVPPAPVQELPRFALGPRTEPLSSTPWFRLPSDRGFGVFVAGNLTPADRLALDWGRLDRGRIDPLATSDIAVKYVPEQFGIASWRFFASEVLPRRSPGASVVRVSVRGAMTPGAAVAVTAPVTYANEQLAERLEEDGSLTLVNPGLLAYLPCVRQPGLSGGAVDVPSRLVRATEDDIWSVRNRVTTPFLGLLDLYRVEQLPLTDSGRPLENIAVFEIDREIEGAQVVPPSKVTLTS